MADLFSTATADNLFSWVDAAGNTNVLNVDIVMTTEDERVAKLTDHVVETGAVVTDHIVIQPESLALELLVTQTPMGGPGMTMQPLALEVGVADRQTDTHRIEVRQSQFQPGGFLLVSSGLQSVTNFLLRRETVTPQEFVGSNVVEKFSSLQARTLQSLAPADRVNQAFDTLIGIMNSGLLVTVSFKGRLYVDYLLTSVGLSQGKGEAGCGRFRVRARAFRTVTGQDVQLPDPADFRSLPKQTKGNQPGKTPDPDPTKRGRSLADRAVGTKSDTARDALVGRP